MKFYMHLRRKLTFGSSKKLHHKNADLSNLTASAFSMYFRFQAVDIFLEYTIYIGSERPGLGDISTALGGSNPPA